MFILIKFQAWDLHFIKIESLAQVFSYEFCKISKNTFSYRTPPVAASDNLPPENYSVDVQKSNMQQFFLQWWSFTFVRLKQISVEQDYARKIYLKVWREQQSCKSQLFKVLE